jgi:hypothetical protein
MRRAAEEQERQRELSEQRRNQTHMPFRFRVGIGETKEAVILDDQPDFFRYEHNMKGPDGKWNVFTGCVKEFDNCPACDAAGRESYYGMYLTVLDFTEFKTRSGETVEFSRKLLVVKPAQHKKFIRFFEKEGTLRGAVFEFTRDGDKDSSIGNDIEFVEFMEEDELATYTREWTDQEKKKHAEDCSEPYDYEELFEPAETEKLRALVGGKPAPGSRAEEQAALGGERRRRGRAEEPEEDAPPPRAARGGRGAPAPAPRSRGAAPRRGGDMEDWQDPDATDEPPWEGAEEPAEAAPRRGRGRVEEPAAPPARRGRAAPVEEEPEEPPRRGRGRAAPEEEPAPAPRRVQPRRGR